MVLRGRSGVIIQRQPSYSKYLESGFRAPPSFRSFTVHYIVTGPNAKKPLASVLSPSPRPSDQHRVSDHFFFQTRLSHASASRSPRTLQPIYSPSEPPFLLAAHGSGPVEQGRMRRTRRMSPLGDFLPSSLGTWDMI